MVKWSMILLLVLAFAVRAQEVRGHNPLDQGGDNCSDIYIIPSLPFSDTGSTFGRLNDFEGADACSGGGSNASDVIYRFSAPVSATYTVSLCASNFDCVLEVRTAQACPGSVQVACNDDFCGTKSQVSFSASGGIVYYVIIDGYGTNSGDYGIEISYCIPPCSGDNCASAIPINTVPYTDTGTTVGRWDDFGTAVSCAPGSTAPDVIYRLTAPATGEYHASLCGGDFDNVLEVRTGGTCPGTTQITCDDNEFCGYNAEVSFAGTAGTVYYLIVDGAGTAQGGYTLNVTYCSFPACQPGDLVECAETQDSTHYWQDCDGGSCNLLYGGNATFQDVSCNQAVCANLMTYRGPNNVNARDTDWYRLTVSELSDVRTTLTTTVPARLRGITQLGSCSQYQYIAPAPACSSSALDLRLSTGVYYFMVHPDVVGGLAPSPYRIEFSCTPARPDCPANSVYSQRPENADETPQYFESDLFTGQQQWESFAGLSSPVSSVRFWGAFGSFGMPCQDAGLQQFHIAFYSNSGGLPGTEICSYNVSAMPLPGDFVPPYPSALYDVPLSPPCTLSEGWISIEGSYADPFDCAFQWLSAGSGQGNGTHVQGVSSYSTVPGDLSLCLSSAQCPPVDSLTVRALTSPLNTVQLDYHVAASGYVRLYGTTSTTAIYPVGFSVAGGSHVNAAGHYSTQLPAANPYMRYVATLDSCGL